MKDAENALRILNALPGVGPVTLKRLLEFFDGDARAVLAASPAQLSCVKGVGDTLAAAIADRGKRLDLAKEDAALAALGARWLGRDDRAYPPLLRELPDPPVGLYARGTGDVGTRAVAIVGTRIPTFYGRDTARALGAELARLGFCVVSGGARGIDTAAHEGALSVGGKTAAVFGCGLDIVYPPENLDLFRKIAENGVVFSEFALGRKADRQTFPQRNRLISGMTLATVVVESGARGGSMLTARFAGEQGRHVFAVPGRIDQESSRGCHLLIRDGATLLTCVDDILEALSLNGVLEPPPSAAASAPEAAAGGFSFSDTEAALMRHFAGGALLSADDLAARTQLPPSVCAATLLMLELKHALAKHADGRYEAR